MANREVMADGMVTQPDADPDRLISLVNACVESVDATMLPVVRAEMERGRREGRQEAHAADLLEVLRIRGICLPTAQVEKLQGRVYEELPEIWVALEAENADDFARRTGL